MGDRNDEIDKIVVPQSSGVPLEEVHGRPGFRRQRSQQSNFRKRRLISPLLVSLYKGFILGALAYFNPSLRSLLNVHNLAYWSITFVCFGIYMICSLGDPGFQLACPADWLEEENANEGAKLERLRTRHIQTDPVLVVVEPDEMSGTSNVEEAESFDKDSSVGSLGPCRAVVDFGEGHGGVVSLGGIELTRSIGATSMGTTSMGTTTMGATSIGAASIGTTLVDLCEVYSGEVPPTRRFQVEQGEDEKEEEPSSRNVTFVKRLLRDPASFTTTKASRVLVFLAAILRRQLFSCGRCIVSCGRGIKLWCRLFTTPCMGAPMDPRLTDRLADAHLTQMSEIFQIGVNSLYQNGESLMYCRVCDQWKLLRTKHCKDCRCCVRLFDHHCPWLGTCVGERNRTVFLYFLMVQSVELWWTVFLIVSLILFEEPDWLDTQDLQKILPRVLLFVQIIALGSLGLMTVGLCIFHGLLIGMNLTTWELMSWHRISYLKRRNPTVGGSPFGSDSLTKNCQLACVVPTTLQAVIFRVLRGRSKPAGKLLKPSARFSWGPREYQVWLAKQRSDPDYRALPKILVTPCYNMYSLCI